jgi:hypothetical protein
MFMKKIMLLYIFIYAGTLTGMENPEPKSSFYYLLPELRYTIVTQALESSDTLKDTINAIKALSIVYGLAPDKLFSDLTSFTKIAHILANKFNTITDEVAGIFDTSTAQKYHQLGHSLLDFAGYNNQKVIELINEGADVNFSSHKTPLYVAIENFNVEGVKILLAHGAKPAADDELAAISKAKWNPDVEEAATIKRLIEEAIEKSKS